MTESEIDEQGPEGGSVKSDTEDGTTESPLRTAAEYSEVLAHAQEVLDAVDRSLDRLDRHTYGTCTECGAVIDVALLAESPTSETCAAHTTTRAAAGS